MYNDAKIAEIYSNDLFTHYFSFYLHSSALVHTYALFMRIITNNSINRKK